ncbi:hypothetical protein M378DRAFT_1057413 [Amanita muscaria Koide BX008]|uniref:Uncharacterized protein n=1 Tax=Amanita muscaria (strain Koide BX008) TaxID=946122 RepID=A0A0C2SYU6_AMAMK|nr:hypothetical protein M378DRAFT_1057413 [Amanita muscaria Koide BX008]
MNRKRSDDNSQNLPQSKRLKTPSVNPMPSTSAVHGDRDGPQMIDSSFNVQDQYHDTIFPSETSIPPLRIQAAHAVMSGTSDVSGLSPLQSSMHQGGDGVIQSDVVFYGGMAPPSYYQILTLISKHVIAALEEHQDSQDTQTEGRNYCQHSSCTEEIPAQTFVNSLSSNGDSSLSEGSPQFSISRRDREAQNASLDRPDVSTKGSRSPCKAVSRSEKSSESSRSYCKTLD